MPPRRGDGFAEAVSSPAQLNQRFTFGLSGEQNLTIPGLAQLETQAGTYETFSLIDFKLKKVLLPPPPPLGNFADISYLEEYFKRHLLRDVCTLCSGALVSDSLLHMLL